MDAEKNNDVYLSLEIRKSEGKTDEYGNYIFEVEASNENLDLQNQIVLQNALMESKDDFLKGGVISYDHLHKRKNSKGEIISDPSMVIGEPVDVIFDRKNKSTVVIGKLYATNDKAKEIIKMLKAGSTRVRASVGGIFPEIIKNVRDGVEKITHVLWNDLALTTSPVNSTVGNAVFAKSMTSAEFVEYLPIETRKSLCAGYTTDSAELTGGQALIPEDTATKTADTSAGRAGADEKEIIRELAESLAGGEIDGAEEAENYLVLRGIEEGKARQIVREIIHQGGQMMKKSFSTTVSALLKSLTGGNPADEEEVKKGEEEIVLLDDDDIDDDGADYEDEDGEDEEESEDGEEDNGDGEEDEEDGVDGTEVLKSLDYELSEMRKSLKDSRRQMNDLGKAVTDLAKMVYAIGGEKIPPKSVLNKSMTGAAASRKAVAVPKGRPSEDDLYKVQCILAKCVDNGTIDMRKSSMISSDMQKCMYTGKPMNPEYYEFLQKEFAKEAE